MSYSSGAKWSIAALLVVLLLGWKWVLATYSGSSTNEAQLKIAERSLTTFLARNYLPTVDSREFIFGMQLLTVESVLCRMRLTITSPRGWHRDLIEKLKQPTSKTFVVFGGRIYPEQPMLRTIMDFLRFRFLQGLGFSASETPVITVIAEPACQADRLPWHEL